MSEADEVLSVEGLIVSVHGAGGRKDLVREASLSVARGERVGLVGESGSGKTMVSLSVMRLNAEPTRITGGRIMVDGLDHVTASRRHVEQSRGAKVAMVYQDPLSSLNPVHTVGRQVIEAVRAHGEVSRRAARKRAIELLDEVGIADAKNRCDQYPHEFSGGMRQRVVIAMALAGAPDVLIADEPTTALDVTTQDRILKLLDRLSQQRGMGVLFITHDLAVAAGFCSRIDVMYEGSIVESGTTKQIFEDPRHSYTQGLIAALHDLDTVAEISTQRATDSVEEIPPLLETVNVSKTFGHGASAVRAVDDVSLRIHRATTFGLVGESGSGKSTLAQLVLALQRPTSGTVRFNGHDFASMSAAETRTLRGDIQVVLQDPIGALNRRKTIGQALELPLQSHDEHSSTQSRRNRVRELLDLVELPEAFLHRYPHELSGGQCQRVCIARAIALRPSMVVLDEPVSAIDAVIQSQILDLLRDLQEELGLTYLFVSHDLAVVRYMASEIAVMRHGNIVEQASRDTLFEAPEQEYTQQLIEAVPTVDLAETPAVTDGGVADG